MSEKSILVILNSPPYSSAQAKEAIDLVLAAGTFDRKIKLLLTGDGCYLLSPTHAPEAIHQKSLAKMIKALPIYGIETIYALKADIEAKNIDASTSEVPLTLIEAAQEVELTRNADAVLRF